MADDLDNSGVPDGWAPDGLMAGLPAMNAAAGQSTLGAVMTPEQIAQACGTDGQGASDSVPWTVSGQDPGIVPPALTDPIRQARTPPDPAGYARDGEFAAQLQADPNDPNGNTGLGGFAYTAGQEGQFHRGGAQDAQAHGGSTSDGNYDFGVYNAAAGIPLSGALDLANTYGKYFSKYPPDWKMDQTYTSIPPQNVQNITKGYNDYQGGKFGGTD
ncbi:MAG TPA: hypothetical protein VGH23_11040 [Rhizomicrobium sp.]